MINENPEIRELCVRINQRKKFAEKRMADMEKKLQLEMEKLQEENKSDWEILTNWLRENNRLPSDFNDQTHHLSFNLNQNGIRVDRDDSSRIDTGLRNVMVGPNNLSEMPPEIRKSLIKFLQNPDNPNNPNNPDNPTEQ